MLRCEKCGKDLSKEVSFIETAFGETRCEFCYDDYLMTDRGKVEYLIGLAMGELDLKDYDADFLGHVAACWNEYKSELDVSQRLIKEVEEKAKQLGIL
jgi:hypothetical protein